MVLKRYKSEAPQAFFLLFATKDPWQLKGATLTKERITHASSQPYPTPKG